MPRQKWQEWPKAGSGGPQFARTRTRKLFRCAVRSLASHYCCYDSPLQCLRDREADLAFAFGDAGGAEHAANAEWNKLSVARLFLREFGMSDQDADAFKRERAFPDGPGELIPIPFSIVTKTRRYGAARAGHERVTGHGFDPKAIGPALSADQAIVTLRIQRALGFVLLV
jgi:hypothetical protein